MRQATRKQFFFIILNLALVVGLTRVVSSSLDTPTGNFHQLKLRFREMLEAMPVVAGEPNQTVLFLGTSTWQYFLNPAVFDDQLKAHNLAGKSYNLSFAGAIGEPYLSLMKRLKFEFDQRDAKFATSVIEFNPFSMAKQFTTMPVHTDWKLSEIFFNWTMWRAGLLVDPSDSAAVIFSEILRPRDIERVYSAVTKWDPRTTTRLPGVGSLWARPEFAEKPAWSLAHQGLSNWNLPRTRDEFEGAIARIHEPSHWQAVLDDYSARHGVDSQFAFDPEAISMFIDGIKLAKTFSKKVYVVLFQYSPSLQARLDQYMDVKALKQHISEATGVEILDYSKKFEFTDQDFADAEHARQETIDHWLPLLAEKLAADHALN